MVSLVFLGIFECIDILEYVLLMYFYLNRIFLVIKKEYLGGNIWFFCIFIYELILIKICKNEIDYG